MKKADLLSIIDGAKKGTQKDQSTLMNLFWDKIYFFVLSKIHHATDAEDITITTFAKVFRKLKLYNEDFDFLTWVYAIAYNTMVDYTRKKPELNISLDNELNSIDLKSVMPSPEQTLISEQNADLVLQAISQLPNMYAEVIKLRYLEEKTYKEIAEILELSMSNVKVRIKRGKHLLEAEIGQSPS